MVTPTSPASYARTTAGPLLPQVVPARAGRRGRQHTGPPAVREKLTGPVPPGDPGAAPRRRRAVESASPPWPGAKGADRGLHDRAQAGCDDGHLRANRQVEPGGEAVRKVTVALVAPLPTTSVINAGRIDLLTNMFVQPATAGYAVGQFAL